MPSSLRYCACSRRCATTAATAPAAAPLRHFSFSAPRRIATPPHVPSSFEPVRWARTLSDRPLGYLARPTTSSSRVPPPTYSPTQLRRLQPFSSTSAAHATVLDNPYPFPRGRDPSPFDIFHFRRDQRLSAKDVKARYLQLVKIYHPDRRAAIAPSASTSKKGKAKATPDADHEFKSIVAAYELLSSPQRRETYLRTGLGWGSTSGFRPGGGGGAGSASPWSQSTAEYHFRRGRPMTHGRRAAGTYDHWAWSQTWTDPHNPHFRPDEAGAGVGGMSSAGSGSGTAPGWAGQGLLARNGVVFLVLAGLTLTVTPLTAWSAMPSAPPGVDPFAPGSDGRRMSEFSRAGGDGSAPSPSSAWMPRVYDKRHQDAAANLQRARLEARERGHEKRDAIKRRVQEIRRAQALDRAVEVQLIEGRQAGTGHLALPAPPE